MLWIMYKNQSHAIISCNLTDNKDGTFEVWVTKQDGKGLRVYVGNESDARELREAIDYAVESGARTFEIE